VRNYAPQNKHKERAGLEAPSTARVDSAVKESISLMIQHNPVNVSLDVVWPGSSGKHDARLSEVSMDGCYRMLVSKADP